MEFSFDRALYEALTEKQTATIHACSVAGMLVRAPGGYWHIPPIFRKEPPRRPVCHSTTITRLVASQVMRLPTPMGGLRKAPRFCELNALGYFFALLNHAKALHCTMEIDDLSSVLVVGDWILERGVDVSRHLREIQAWWD